MRVFQDGKNSRHVVIQDEQAGLYQPNSCQLEFLADEYKFAAINCILNFIRGESLIDSWGEVIAQVHRHLIDRHDDACISNLEIS